MTAMPRDSGCQHPEVTNGRGRVALTVLGAADAVQRARGNGDDLLPLQPLNLAWPADVVVGAVPQPVVVALPPGGVRTVSQREANTEVLSQSTTLPAAKIPGVDGSRFGQSHGELRAALHFDHAQAGERVDLKKTEGSDCQVFDDEKSGKICFVCPCKLGISSLLPSPVFAD